MVVELEIINPARMSCPRLFEYFKSFLLALQRYILYVCYKIYFMHLPGFTLILGLVSLFFSGCKQKERASRFPAPSEKTVIHTQGEEGDHSEARQAWIELLHGGPESAWRSMENENAQQKYEAWLNSDRKSRSAEEEVAGGNILGRWLERGSSNNAGNIMVVDYVTETEEIYAVGGGGPMFRGDLSGFGWTPVNDKLRFSTNLLKVFTLDNGKKRIVSAVGGIPHYSEDDGLTWKKATGVLPTSDGWEIYNSQVTSDGKIFFLGRKDYNGTIRLYVSYDYGGTFKSLKIFNTSDTRNVALTMNGVNDDIYLIEQINATASNLYLFNPATKSLDIRTPNQPISFGESGRANLQAVTYRDTLLLYAYKTDKKLYISKDVGKSWKFWSALPSEPWDVGVYVCPSDPRKMFYGEVDAFRSINGGLNWSRISEWWQYYDDIYNKLHADIMTVKEFRDKSGKPFILNGNHGGLYYTEDYGVTHINIGLFNLNVSQYYDVRSYPSDHRRVFAGSQDQGQQRGLIDGDNAAELYQNISGDYGHIEFTGNGKSLWSVYPGGSIGFYSQPLSQEGPVAGYEIKSSNETVWIPPIIPGPDPSKNIVLAAGGSTTPTSGGSYILQLEYKNTDITATQLPFNFGVSGGQISAMAIDPQDKNLWYVATTNGHFYRSSDAGQSFTKSAEFLSEAHYLYGSCILPSAVHPDVVYLSGNGYNYKPVYRSENGGATFSDFSNGLPKTMVFNIVANEDESLIFAATESGPYVYIAEKEKWFDLSGVTTPNQTYWSVEYLPAIQTARFGTYGRGIWDFEVKEIRSEVQEQQTASSSILIYPNPASDHITISTASTHLLSEVSVYDMQGKLCLRTSLLFGNKVSTERLKAGNYMVHVKTAQGNTVKKLTIL